MKKINKLGDLGNNQLKCGTSFLQPIPQLHAFCIAMKHWESHGGLSVPKKVPKMQKSQADKKPQTALGKTSQKVTEQHNQIKRKKIAANVENNLDGKNRLM